LAGGLNISDKTVLDVPNASPAGKLRRRRRWRVGAAGLAMLITGFAVATSLLFIWPATGMPRRADAIVMLAGPNAPLSTALALAREHRAPFLVISRGSKGYSGPCPAPVSGLRLICFDPDPPTTQGEAEYVGRLARQYHWRSITLVTITPQAWRAKQRLTQCFSGAVFSVTGSIPWHSWPFQIAYEWGATVKMIFQSNC
jgi:hypothetical protein